MATATSFAGTSSADNRAFLEQSREALHQLAVLLRNSYLHDLSNQVFEEPLGKLEKAIARLLMGEGRFRLERSGEEFFANGNRLRMEIKNLHAYKYVLHELDKRGLGGIAFVARHTIESLSGFLEVFAATRESDDGGSMLTSTYSTSWTREDSVASPSSHAIPSRVCRDFSRSSPQPANRTTAAPGARPQPGPSRKGRSRDRPPSSEGGNAGARCRDPSAGPPRAHRQRLPAGARFHSRVDGQHRLARPGQYPQSQTHRAKARRSQLRGRRGLFPGGNGLDQSARRLHLQSHGQRLRSRHRVRAAARPETTGPGPARPVRALPRHGQATYSSGGAEQTNRTHGRGVGPDG